MTQGVTTLLGRGDEIAAADLAELSAAAPERIAVAIRTQQWAEANPDAPNLCNNPGFEETKADGPTPEGVDWVSTDAPPAWSKWVIDDGTIDQLEWESTGGHDGARCVRIAGIRNGCFIQAVPVEPGEVCYASAWVKTTPSNEFKVNLGVRWQDPNGAWTADASDRFAITTGGPDAWRKLSVVVTVPEGAGFAVILPGTVDQKPDDAVWYDDIRFIKLPDGALD